MVKRFFLFPSKLQCISFKYALTTGVCRFIYQKYASNILLLKHIDFLWMSPLMGLFSALKWNPLNMRDFQMELGAVWCFWLVIWQCRQVSVLTFCDISNSLFRNWYSLVMPFYPTLVWLIQHTLSEEFRYYECSDFFYLIFYFLT